MCDGIQRQPVNPEQRERCARMQGVNGYFHAALRTPTCRKLLGTFHQRRLRGLVVSPCSWRQIGLLVNKQWK
jgi:hypothetical protein